MGVACKSDMKSDQIYNSSPGNSMLTAGRDVVFSWDSLIILTVNSCDSSCNYTMLISFCIVLCVSIDRYCCLRGAEGWRTLEMSLSKTSSWPVNSKPSGKLASGRQLKEL